MSNKSTTLSFTCDSTDTATQEIFNYLMNTTNTETYDYNLIINSPEHKGKIYMFNKSDITFVDAVIDKVSINIREIKKIDPALRLHEVSTGVMSKKK